MSNIYPGRVSRAEIGTGPADHTDVTNVVLCNWEWDHEVNPRTDASQKRPKGYEQRHSWIIGSISLLSDNHTAFYVQDVDGTAAGDQPALTPGGDSTEVDYFRVYYEDEDGDEVYTDFEKALFTRPVCELLNYQDSVWIYHFLAYKATDSDR